MSTASESTSIDTAGRIDELGRIIVTYSAVTEKLQQSHDQLSATVRSLQSELREKNRLLERKKRLAALGEMAAGMAHEIRNPLGGILLYASMLAKDLEGDDASLRLVDKICGGVKRLESLVGQVLQFTREIRATCVEMDLAAAVEQAIEYASGAMNSRGVTCTARGPRPMPVIADPLLIGQAILNLLLNASEAADDGPGGGAVDIQFSPPPPDSDAKQFHLIVRDSGPGIAPQVLEKIFNPFFTTKDGGTGLGLAIVHRVVEAHDGTIIVTNPEGGGAKFEVRV